MAYCGLNVPVKDAEMLVRDYVCAKCHGDLHAGFLLDPDQERVNVSCSTWGCGYPGFITRKTLREKYLNVSRLRTSF
jgi:hypothetical protein